MSRIGLLLVCFAIFAVVFGSCHHDCNNNGECVSGSCSCYDNWTGSDCSEPYLPLNNGDAVHADIDGDWIFYYTTIDSTVSSMVYTMSDAILSDCDLYVRHEEFPSKNHYDYKDSGWDSTSSVHIDSPESGLWIAGVYNFVLCEFDLSLQITHTGNCPNDCSGHGACELDNTCTCDPLFLGEDCSEEIQALADNDIEYGYANHWEWNYYYFDASSDMSNFKIVVNQTDETSNGDSDLYVRKESLPTLWVYDYRNAAIAENYALTVGSPEDARYFIGIYGYSACGYDIHIEVTMAENCDNPCSAHGYCSNDHCTCSANFSGSNCEYMDTELPRDQLVNGYAADNQWNYYHVTANTASNMQITIAQGFDIQNGDCDLYIQANEYPDRFHYDYRDIGFADTFSVTVQNPLDTTWYIGVYGYHACQYYISESISNNCPNDCSGHGSCVDGRCACNSGYAGQDCGSPLTRIHSGDEVSDNVGQNAWHYYKYTIPSHMTSVTIELLETNSEGYLAVYVLEGAPPELTGYQYSEDSLNALHTLYFLFDGSADIDHDFYIGIYGTSRVPIQSTAEYELFVYSPPI